MRQGTAAFIDSVYPITVFLVVGGIKLPYITVFIACIYLFYRLGTFKKCLHDLPSKEHIHPKRFIEGHLPFSFVLFCCALYSLGCIILSPDRIEFDYLPKSSEVNRIFANLDKDERIFVCKGKVFSYFKDALLERGWTQNMNN